MKPICVRCERFFRIEKNGVYFVENMTWTRPYKLWAGDQWKCPGCGAEIISGTGLKPVSEYHEKDFAEQIERRGAKLKING